MTERIYDTWAEQRKDIEEYHNKRLELENEFDIIKKSKLKPRCMNCDFFNNNTGECTKWNVKPTLQEQIQGGKCFVPKDFIPF